MITLTDQEPAQEIKHIWWDVCNCKSCLDEAIKNDDDDEDLPNKQKSSQQKLKRRYEKGDPTVGLLGESSGKFDYYVLYPKAELSQPLSPPHKTPPSPHKPPPTSPPPPKLSPYNQKALSILHQDSPSENVVAQNKVLVKILSQQGMITNSQEYLSLRVRSLKSIINELHFKIQELHREIIQIIRTSPTTQPSSYISQKEAEIKNLNNQLQDLEWQHKQKRINSLIDDPWRLPSTPFIGVSFDPQPLPQSYTHTTSPSLNIWASEQRRLKPSTRKDPTFSQESQSIADVALNQVEPVDVSDLESLYSLDDEPSDSVLCTIAYSNFSSDDDSDTYSLESDSDFGIHMINPIPHVLPIQEDPPLPLAKIHLLTDAYAKPILVIAFFDTGSSVSILNPNILPDHYWKPHHQNFIAANGEKFVIDKISVPINIWLFPKCAIKRRLLGSSSHGKDLFIGFDILHKLPNLRWSANDKFPLPQKKSLFQHLADAKVLFKFDLKLGFWQLENAPSAFQKAMITIFEPILDNTLVYIDDNLLFSSDEQSHAELLSMFYSLVTKYGIMLSKKKMEIGVTTIQFLGMEISDGKYQPQPHVAQELLKFPNELSSKKMIQQFLGQTKAVKAIKCLTEKMPPLKIPASAEKRILQTDASDECWGAVLLVQDNNNKRHVCRYKSDTFKASEQHYHSTFKEILTVIRGIEKFQFHLIGHEFLVEMDMSSFPCMLQFKRKMLPHAQLLWWSNWFSRWKFTVKHIKGTENVLADFLSRPKAYKS
ncbi:putative reverse transcriptase domain, viral movement protein [Tanacetum coccineum]